MPRARRFAGVLHRHIPAHAAVASAPCEEGPADLYVCEVLQATPQCKLNDLTVDPGFDLGESAEVVGTVLGASADGTYVYFVANGVLDAKARCWRDAGVIARPHAKHAAATTSQLQPLPGALRPQSASWDAPRFIARLSQEDQPDWGTTGGGSLGAADLPRLPERALPGVHVKPNR